MASTADFRNGMVMEIDGDLWAITYFQHVKPGKGGAFVRTKLKNVLTGAVVDKTYRAGEKVTDVRLERRPVGYSYTDGSLYHFMDQATFDRCINDQEEMDRILARVQDAQKDYDVRSTPTLIINGKKLVGGMSYPEFEKALEAAAPKS